VVPQNGDVASLRAINPGVLGAASLHARHTLTCLATGCRERILGVLSQERQTPAPVPLRCPSGLIIRTREL